MEKSSDFEAILDNSCGTIGGRGHSYGRQEFGKDAPHKADDNGEFIIKGDEKDYRGFVDQVTYVACHNQPQVRIDDKRHSFTFKQFLEMGRPWSIKVTKTFEYENLAKSAVVSS